MAEGLAQYLGNIDLNARKVYINPETGQKQTEFSRSFAFGSEDNPVEVLLPTIIDGKPVNDEGAIKHYLNTGEHLGKFNRNEWLKSNPNLDIKSFYKFVDDYANSIHERQDKRYSK